MHYRTLGDTGLSLSEVSLGTMYYGSHIPREAGLTCLHRAVDVGINFIDSADRYGIEDSDLPPDEVEPAEAVVGEFLEGHDRCDLVVSTKVHHQLRDSPNSGGLSRKHVREQLRKSLDHLGTDYVDLYFCHRPDPDTALVETVRVMSDLVREGSVHYWGTSWWPPHLVERAIGIARTEGCVPPAVEQPPYHLRARYIESDLFEVARHHGLGLTAFEALSVGVFTGKYNDDVPEGSRFDELDLADDDYFDELRPKLREMQAVADECGLEMAQLALAWVLTHDEVTSTITGARKPEQVEQNASASGIELDPDTVERLESVFEDRAPDFPYRYG